MIGLFAVLLCRTAFLADAVCEKAVASLSSVYHFIFCANARALFPILHLDNIFCPVVVTSASRPSVKRATKVLLPGGDLAHREEGMIKAEENADWQQSRMKTSLTSLTRQDLKNVDTRWFYLLRYSKVPGQCARVATSSATSPSSAWININMTYRRKERQC